jgi:hypothetical protein
MTTCKTKCECDVCKYSEEVAVNLEFVHEDHREFFEDLYMRYCAEAMDADVNMCIIEGSWPTANEYIISARKRTGIPLPIIE